MNKRVKCLAVIIALFSVITACSKQEKEDGLTVTSQATSQEMRDVNSDDAVIEIPMPDDFYPFVPDRRTVYPVQDFDSDTDNQPYNIQGNTNENRLNDEYDAEYQYGTVARQGAYTYYIHNGAIFRMKDDEQEGVPILSVYQPEAGSDIFNKRIYGLSVVGNWVYYISDYGNILYRFSMVDDAAPQPLASVYRYTIIADTVYALNTVYSNQLISFSAENPVTAQVLLDVGESGILSRLSYSDQQLYYIYSNMEKGISTIERIYLDGSGRETVYSDNPEQLFNVVDGWIYFTILDGDKNSESLVRYHLEQEELQEIIPAMTVETATVKTEYCEPLVSSEDGAVYYKCKETIGTDTDFPVYRGSRCMWSPSNQKKLVLYDYLDENSGTSLAGNYLYTGQGLGGVEIARYELKENGSVLKPSFTESPLSSVWESYEN